MKKTAIFLLTSLALVVAQEGHSQFLDSIQTSFQHRPRLDFRIDTRNSFITTQFARILGVKVGLDFNNRVKVGLGYNRLISDIERKQFLRVNDIVVDTIAANLDFEYLSPYMEYTFFREGKWEMSIPVLIGVGRSRFGYTGLDGKKAFSKGQLVILYEPYMTGQYRFLNWFALGAGVGYRLLFVGSGSVQENFNSPIYVLKFKFYFGDLYRTVFPTDE